MAVAAICLLAGCVAPPGLGAAADAASASGARSLVIQGGGDGHGVGMSQQGALGYAEHGWSYAAILAHYYSGTALGRVARGRKVRVLLGGRVVRIGLERYVRGVVAAEMPASWPMAALEAQAVASRTYALTDHAGGGAFDVYADTRSQVYGGRAAETARTNAAVAATAGEVVTYGARPAITYFFASSGGITENVQDGFPGAQAEPWLRGVPDPYDGGPLHRWKVRMGFAEAAARLAGLVRGRFEGIEVLRRGFSPRVVSAEVLGSEGPAEVSGPELEARLGLDSTWAYFSVAGPGWVHREPDRSHYRTPAGTAPGAGTPPAGGTTPGTGGVPGGTAPSAPPSAEHGGSAAASSLAG
ncbi:MAG: SpoIID/LytB domain-containing protein [Acidobacteriota bacterium]|nr:SpoIID/LytB domain-containing protein [Acidobacteriota bacterium]